MEISSRRGSDPEVEQQQQQSGVEKKQEQLHLEQQRAQRREDAGASKQQQQDDNQELIDEWLRLRLSATRTPVLAAIDRELRHLGYDNSFHQRKQLQQHEKNGEQHHNKQQQEGKDISLASGSSRQSVVPANAGLPPAPFLPLTSFAWDQTAEVIKLYVKLAGVQQLPKENIRMHAGQRSIELEFVGVDSKNYSFAQKTLSNPIIPANCCYRVKRDMVVVTLRKASPTWWTELSQRRDTKPPSPKLDENADPGASIMAMMKNLYEEGDDEMKRMIAKSWTQSQEEKMGGKSPFADMSF